jgi:ParB family chromosome partitioning protein
MAKGNRRPITAMAQGAISAQKDDEIERLKQELDSIAKDSRGSGAIDLPVDRIFPLKISTQDDGRIIHQPRSYFDQDRLDALKQSIAENGLHEPIFVRQLSDGLFGIIDGERRWRCHKELGKVTIPGFLLEGISDEKALERSLTSHCLREQVSPLEQTISIMNLLRLRLAIDEATVRRLLYALNNAAVGNSKTADFETYQAQTVQGILNSLGLQLGSLVARLPLLDLPIYLRDAVEGGKVNPTNALLIARSPETLHHQLLEQGATLSKRELRRFITELKQFQDVHPSTNGNSVAAQEAKEEDSQFLTDIVNAKWKRIQQSKFIKNGGDSRVQRKLVKVRELLQEIEEYIATK